MAPYPWGGALLVLVSGLVKVCHQGEGRRLLSPLPEKRPSGVLDVGVLLQGILLGVFLSRALRWPNRWKATLVGLGSLQWVVVLERAWLR